MFQAMLNKMRVFQNILFALAFCASATISTLVWAEEGDVKVSVNSGKLEISSLDKDFKMVVGGYLLQDYAIYSPDVAHSEFTQGSKSRALRLGMEGTLWKKWSFKAQYDFSGDGTKVRHSWMQYHFDHGGRLQIGMQDYRFGVQSTASISGQIFMERALFHRAWGNDYYRGLTYNNNGENWYASLGVFEDKESVSGANRQNIYYARAAFLPIKTDDQFLHIGATYARANYFNAAAPSFSANPGGTKATKLELIKTGAISNPENMESYVAEFIYSVSSLTLMSEYSETKVPSATSGNDFKGSGYYADLMWMVTGEKFPYSIKKATFGGVKPKQNMGYGDGCGAWALSIRYDKLDLDQGSLKGGVETDITGAVTWWPNPNIKFIAQATKTNSEKATVKDDPTIYSMRAQVSF